MGSQTLVRPLRLVPDLSRRLTTIEMLSAPATITQVIVAEHLRFTSCCHKWQDHYC